MSEPEPKSWLRPIDGDAWTRYWWDGIAFHQWVWSKDNEGDPWPTHKVPWPPGWKRSTVGFIVDMTSVALTDPTSGVDDLSGIVIAAAVGSLAGFLASLSKVLGDRAANTGADLLVSGGRKVKAYFQSRARPGTGTVSVRSNTQLLVVENVDRLPDKAWEQLVAADLPSEKGTIQWDPLSERWRVLPP